MVIVVIVESSLCRTLGYPPPLPLVPVHGPVPGVAEEDDGDAAQQHPVPPPPHGGYGGVHIKAGCALRGGRRVAGCLDAVLGVPRPQARQQVQTQQGEAEANAAEAVQAALRGRQARQQVQLRCNGAIRIQASLRSVNEPESE